MLLGRLLPDGDFDDDVHEWPFSYDRDRLTVIRFFHIGSAFLGDWKYSLLELALKIPVAAESLERATEFDLVAGSVVTRSWVHRQTYYIFNLKTYSDFVLHFEKYHICSVEF